MSGKWIKQVSKNAKQNSRQRPTLEKYYEQRLQKQMDEDYTELMIDEQEMYAKNGGIAPHRSIEPAYMEGDVFEHQKNTQILKTQQERQREKAKEEHLIQPNKTTGKVWTVSADE